MMARPLRQALGPRMSGGGATEWLTSYKAPTEQFMDWDNRPPVSELPELTRQLYEDTGIINDVSAKRLGPEADTGQISKPGVQTCDVVVDPT